MKTDRHDIQNCVLIYWISTSKLKMDTIRNVTKRNWRQTPNNTLLVFTVSYWTTEGSLYFQQLWIHVLFPLRFVAVHAMEKKQCWIGRLIYAQFSRHGPPIPAAVRGNCANENKKKINKYIRISNLLNPSANRFVVIGDAKLTRSRAYCMNGRQELAEREGSCWRKRMEDNRKDKEGIMKEK